MEQAYLFKCGAALAVMALILLVPVLVASWSRVRMFVSTL
jgi:hypothetical protein